MEHGDTVFTDTDSPSLAHPKLAGVFDAAMPRSGQRAGRTVALVPLRAIGGGAALFVAPPARGRTVAYHPLLDHWEGPLYAFEAAAAFDALHDGAPSRDEPQVQK